MSSRIKTNMPGGNSRPEGKTRGAVGKKVFWALLAVFVLCIGGMLVLLAVNWPFTREAMTKQLEHASSTKVEVRGFRSTYFPYPGCVLEGVTFRPAAVAGAKPGEPIISIRRLTIESTFAGLFRKTKTIR
ncbi:MAG TPA: hypothetical protein VFT65_10705, partial [Candidatus Angelobacter sp.]|nr:hypothetical protein [Candidatus Angelobacter sp.]